ncbi:MAG: hypothetical protein ABJB34_10045 [Acidobacteriota bacterium]
MTWPQSGASSANLRQIGNLMDAHLGSRLSSALAQAKPDIRQAGDLG